MRKMKRNGPDRRFCPTCGQQLPAEQIEEAKENFNTAKAQNLETINKRGMTECSSGMIKKEQDEIEALTLAWWN